MGMRTEAMRRRRTTRLSIAAIAALAAALALAGCGNRAKDTQSDSSGAAIPKGATVIDFWYAIGGRNGEGVVKLVDEFNASQSKVHVKATYQGDYYAHATKLQAALVAKNQPDVVMLEIAQVGQFGYSKALADLGKYMTKDEIGKFQEGLLKNSYIDGKFVAAPFNRSTPILYVNKTMLKEAGLDPAGPKDWNELRTYAKKLSNKEKGVYGFEVPIDIWFFEAGVFQKNGKILSEDGKKFVFAEEGGAEIVRLWQQMIREGGMKVPPGQDYNAWDVAASDLITQKVAMMMISTASLSGLIAQAEGKFELGTAFLPAGEIFATPTGGANLAVLEKSDAKSKQAAAAFIKFLASKDKAAFFSEWTGYMPVTTEAVQAESIQALYSKHPQYKTALDQLQYAQTRPMIKGYREMTVKIQEELKKAMYDLSISPEEAARNAQAAAQAVLDSIE